MAIDMQKETYRGFGRIKLLTAQTAVECRFAQEVQTVLSVHCFAALTGAEAGNGEVKYFGKASFIIVYEDGEKHVCRGEKGVEFSAVCKDEEVYPALTARASVAVENVSVRREGASVFTTALLGADISLYGESSFEYLSGGDLILKREGMKAVTAHLCGGAAEAEDEFETEPLGDILLHTEAVNVTDVLCETGIVKLEGEINLCVLALKHENSLASFERLVPFTIEIPCEAATFGCGAEAHVSVVNATLRADTDEEKGKCRIFAQFTLSAEACVYEELTVDGVTDAYSCEKEVALSFAEATLYGAPQTVHFTERISGKAALSSPIDFSDTLQAVALQRAEGSFTSGEHGKKIEGVAMATLLVLGADGTHRAIEMSLPFSVAAEGSGTVSVLVCGMSARQRQEGEIEAEATLKICVSGAETYSLKLVSGAEEGAPLPVSDSAVSVYIPCEGDGLWELSKRLHKAPEDVEASNPDLEFPVRADQRIIIYRKRSLT